MQEQIVEILFYLRGTLRYKWRAFGSALVLCLIGWVVVFFMPNKYTSEAKVHVETRTMLQPLLEGMTVKSDTQSLLRVMRLLMFTKTNLEQIVKLSELNKTVKTPLETEKLYEDLRKDIKINGGADEIFTIEYEANDPDTAKNVVQAVLTVFSEQTQKSTLQGADAAHHFIDEQIKEYETRLRNGEKAQENFKRANLHLLTSQEGGGNQIEQIQKIKSTLEESKLALKEANSRKAALTKQLQEALASGSDDDWEILDNKKDIDPDDKQMNELVQKRDDLLIKYTPNHPSVIYIDKTLEDLKKKKAEKQAKAAESGNPDTGALKNPYIQTIKVALNETEVNIASITSRIDSFQQRLDKAQQELNARLSVETEMANLNRDYASIKHSYDKLLQSREQATMSEKVDNQAEALKFKIADAPNVPLEPSSPKRKLLYTVVLIVGLILGWLVACGFYIMRPTVISVAQLRKLTGLPVLGAVTLKVNAKDTGKNKRDVIWFNMGMVFIIAIYAGFMAVDMLKN